MTPLFAIPFASIVPVRIAPWPDSDNFPSNSLPLEAANDCVAKLELHTSDNDLVSEWPDSLGRQDSMARLVIEPDATLRHAPCALVRPLERLWRIPWPWAHLSRSRLGRHEARSYLNRSGLALGWASGLDTKLQASGVF